MIRWITQPMARFSSIFQFSLDFGAIRHNGSFELLYQLQLPDMLATLFKSESWVNLIEHVADSKLSKLFFKFEFRFSNISRSLELSWPQLHHMIRHFWCILFEDVQLNFLAYSRKKLFPKIPPFQKSWWHDWYTHVDQRIPLKPCFCQNVVHNFHAQMHKRWSS